MNGLFGRFAAMIYGPTLLYGLAEGALLPLLPVITASRGASIAEASLLAAVLVGGRVIGNVPAGWLVFRIGERLTIVAAAAVALASCGGIVVSASFSGLMASVFAIGLCGAAFGLARHSFMTTYTPLPQRARALSVLGGSARFGAFIGPFAAALLLGWFSTERAVVGLFACCLLAIIALVLLAKEPPRPAGRDGGEVAAPVGRSRPSAPRRRGIFATAWRFRRSLVQVGLPAAALSAVRNTRAYALPLWGFAIGLDAQTIALMVGLTGAIELALFYTGGQMMDRWGRLWAVLPAMTLMSGSFIALMLSSGLPGQIVWYVVCSVIAGIGNGLSSGALLTIGADLAPARDPASFLGAWRMVTDTGGASASLIVSAVTAVSSLPLAVGVIGGLGLLGAAGFVRFLPRRGRS